MKYIQKKEERVVKTFESFIGAPKNNYSDYENLSKPDITGEVDMATKNKILDVVNFNEWLKNDFSGYGYQKGAPGLIGRVDKLSEAMIVSYFLEQGVECTSQEIMEFQDKIRKEWNK